MMVTRKNCHKKGQAMVEWAVVLPVLMVTIFTIFQWCLIEVANQLTIDAARKACRARLVNENYYDAAAITLMPVAGWTDTLEASAIAPGGAEVNMEIVSNSASLGIPGWSAFPRSRYIPDRLQVELLEEDWDKVSVQVNFYCELLFPFVDVFFADIREQSANLTGTAVDEMEQVGIGTIHSDSMSGYTAPVAGVGGLKAKNFIELRARFSMSHIDKPLSPDIVFGNWQGIQDPSAAPQLVTPGDPTTWSTP